jgi:uncharacterized protein
VELRPASKLVVLGANGAPHIRGFRCGACGATYATPSMACRACGGRQPPEAYKAAETGTLHTWSIVHRSFPGVAVPFVSAIVDLADGLAVKGTLKGVDHAALRQGLPVRLVFDDAGGARGSDGAAFVGFHFVPEGDAR